MTDLGSWEYYVEAGRIQAFATAVRAPECQTAPPTFSMLAGAEKVEWLVGEKLGLDPRRTAHCEQSFEYFAPIRAGMVLQGQARLVSDLVKEGRVGGKMRVVTIEFTYIDRATGSMVLRETMTTIEKGA